MRVEDEGGAPVGDRRLGGSRVAGTAFGATATHSLRVSYANSQPNLEEALARMRRFLEAEGGR